MQNDYNEKSYKYFKRSALIVLFFITTIMIIVLVSFHVMKKKQNPKNDIENRLILCLSNLDTCETQHEESIISLKLAEYKKPLSDFLKLFCSMCEVKKVERLTKQDTYTVTLSIPNLSKLKEKLIINDDFIAEYEKLNTMKADNSDKEKLIFKYCNVLLNSSEIKYKIYKCEINYAEKIQDDIWLVNLFKEVNPIKSLSSNNIINKTKKQKDNLASLSINKGNSFVVNINQKHVVITLEEFKMGNKALSALKSLSDFNKNLIIDSDEDIAYIEYSVHNLESKSVLLENGFHAVDEHGNLFDLEDSSVFGLKDSIKLKANSSKKMNCVLVGSKNFSVVWQLKNCPQVIRIS